MRKDPTSVKWFHSFSDMDSFSHGPFDTKEEAQADAAQNYDPGEHFWFHCGTSVLPEDAADWLASGVQDMIDSGNFELDLELGAEDPVLEISTPALRALSPLLAQWIKEHKLLAVWYTFTHSERGVLPAEPNEAHDG